MSDVRSLVLDSSLLPFSPIEALILSSIEKKKMKMTKPARKLMHECVAKMLMVRHDDGQNNPIRSDV